MLQLEPLEDRLCRSAELFRLVVLPSPAPGIRAFRMEGYYQPGTVVDSWTTYLDAQDAHHQATVQTVQSTQHVGPLDQEALALIMMAESRNGDL